MKVQEKSTNKQNRKNNQKSYEKNIIKELNTLGHYTI